MSQASIEASSAYQIVLRRMAAREDVISNANGRYSTAQLEADQSADQLILDDLLAGVAPVGNAPGTASGALPSAALVDESYVAE